MTRRFAHLTKKELKEIRDTPTMGDTIHGSKRSLSNNPTVDQIEAIAELDERRVRKTVHITLIIGFIAMMFAGIAAWPVIREWFPISKPASITPANPTSQQNSKPKKLPLLKKSLSEQPKH